MSPTVSNLDVPRAGQWSHRSGTPVRVLHVIAGLNPGGIETWLMHIVHDMDRKRFEHEFCLYRLEGGPLLADLLSLDIPVHRHRLGGGLLGYVRFAREFSALLRHGDFDVVHCHGTLLTGFFVLLAERAGVPVRIAHAHSAAPVATGVLRAQVGRLLRRWIWRHATAGLACSSVAADAVFGPNWQADPRFGLLHCAIDPAPFKHPIDRLGLRAEWGLSDHALVVGHVGNFSPVKNYGFLIELAREAIRRDPRVYFLLVGDGAGRAAVAATIRALGIEKRVLLTGVRRDVPCLMRAVMDVLVFPSFAEGLPMTLIEAQAAGLPCVVSDAVCREAEVAPGRLDLVPLSAATDAWLERIFAFLSSPRLDTAEALRQLNQTDFVIEQSTRKLADAYAGALMQRPPKSR
jgi:glycosyltransferase involved in cell wall biosynthesis